MADATLIMRRYGGSEQVLLRSVDELLLAIELPEPWWAATACPIAGMRCDPQVLQHLDRDGDGLVHRDDLCRAARWMVAQLADTAGCVPGSDALALDQLASAAGKLRDAAQLVQRNLGVEDATRVTLAQVRSHKALMKPGESNGDGVVPPDRIEDPEQRATAEAALGVVPGEEDRGGGAGVSIAVIDAFAAARDAALAWFAEGDRLDGWDAAVIARAREVLAVDPAVRGWFELSRLAAVDPRRAGRIANPEVVDPDPNDPEAMRALLASLPIAPPSPDGLLRWDELAPSPAGDRLRALQQALGPELEDHAGFPAAAWDAVSTWARGLVAWADAEASLPASALGRERLGELSDARLEAVRAICRLDAEWADEIAAIDVLEELLLYRRWLFRIANNFLNFSELYALDERALFEHGSFFIGGRELRFSMLVGDRTGHQKLAQVSGIRVLYIEVAQGGAKREYAVPVTAGQGNDLVVGRRGVFRDIDGDLRPGTVVQVVENPVSLGEAIVQPFVRIGGSITQRLEQWQNQAGKDLEASVKTAGEGDAPPPPPPPPSGGGSPLLGGSIAFAALGSSFAFVTKQLASIQAITVVLAILGLIAVILIPTAILAAVRLHRRNLAALLEANGWAINDRMRLTWAQGKLFTRRPALPPQARSELHDEVASILAAKDPAVLRANRIGILTIVTAVIGLVAMLAAVLLLAPFPPIATWTACGAGAAILLSLGLGSAQRRDRPGLLGVACLIAVFVVALGGWIAWRVLLGTYG